MFFILRIVAWKRRIIDRAALFIAGICKNGFLFLHPLFMIVNPAHRQHDVHMGIAHTLIMQGPVSNHSFAYKILLNIGSHTGNLFVAFHFRRERHLDFPRKLRIRTFLDLLYFVP